jgi:hypothetical protein
VGPATADGGGRDGFVPPTDGSPPPPDGALLATLDCDAVLGSKLLDEDFLDEMTEFQNLFGTYRVQGGSVVMVGPEEYALLQSFGEFRDVVSCSRVRMGRTAAPHQLGSGLRGPMHGVNVRLTAHEGTAVLFSLEPTTNVVLAEVPITTWTSGMHDFTVLVYVAGTRAYAEVKDETTGEVVVLSGTYAGEQEPVNSTFEGSPLAEDVTIDRVVVGPPTAAAARVLRGE